MYIISNSLYTEMSKTIYDMCDLPELPQLTEENLQSVTVEGAASTLLRPIDKETPPTRRPGRRRSPSPGLPAARTSPATRTPPLCWRSWGR